MTEKCISIGSLLSAKILNQAGIEYEDIGFTAGRPDAADSYHLAKEPDTELTLDQVVTKVWEYHKKQNKTACTKTEMFDFYENAIRMYSDQAAKRAIEIQGKYTANSTPKGLSTKEDEYLLIATTSDNICTSAGHLFGGIETARARFSNICNAGGLLRQFFKK